MINRQELAEELKLRRQIRQAIKIVKEKKKVAVDKVLQEEQTLRNIIRRLINEAEVSDEVPEHSTGINFLKELLTKILPKLEKAYKRLTTSKEQRGSFRAHVVKKIQDMLAPEKVLDQAADHETVEAEPEALREIDIEIEDDEAQEADPFLDVDTVGEKQPEEDTVEDFGIEGLDLTGRNAAFKIMKEVESIIIDTYNELSDEHDKTEFYDYLITNIKMHFDNFESELQPSGLPEPTTPEYEQEKETAETPVEEPAPEEETIEF